MPEENNQSPLVTIITISKDPGQALVKTIESVLAQTHSHIQYIIIDGASGEETQAILNGYRDRVDLILSEPDRGISHAFNKGLERAKGQLVGLLNAGDTYVPEAVEWAVKWTLGGAKDAGADFCYGDCLFHESETYSFVMQGEANYLRRLHYRMPVFNHPTVFIKRSIYEEYGGFDEKWKTCMDYELLYRMIKKGKKGVYIAKVMAEMDRDGISIHNNRRAIREVKDISRLYGLAAYKAWCYYGFGLFKEIVGQPIRRRFGDGLTRLYRKWFIQGYKNSNEAPYEDH